MKKPEMIRRAAGALAVALFCGLTGCSPSVEPPDSSLFANAMEDYQAGNYEQAIHGFNRVLKNNPKDHLAHLQLAIALQDKKKDYLGAIIHYSLYLEFRPEDDKTKTAADRMQACKDLLLAEHARQSGNAPVRKAAPSEGDKKLAAENARLTAEVRKLKEGNKKLGATLHKLEPCLDVLDKGRAENLRNEVKKVLAAVGDSETKETRRPLINPTTTQLLDDDSEDGPLASSPEVKAQLAQAKSEEDSGPARPPAIVKPPLIVNSSQSPDPKPVPGGARVGATSGSLNGLLGGGKKPSGSERPDTYKVQPHETLSDIAERFYGARGKWRDIQKANMATIPADGRVKAGQVIKLP